MAMPVPLPDRSDDAGQARGGVEAEPVGPMTFDEYLDYEGEGDTRYEYVGGMVYAKSNGTVAHGTISFNIAVRLHADARRSGCLVQHNTLAVRTRDDRGYVPDVIVHCGPRLANDDRYLEHPCFIVEVLSPSTARIDRHEKLPAYCELPSLQTYWMVEATWRCVHRHWRDADGRWQSEDVTGDVSLPVPCPVATTLTLDEVYEDVDVPREPPRPILCRVREPDAGYAVNDVPEYAD